MPTRTGLSVKTQLVLPRLSPEDMSLNPEGSRRATRERNSSSVDFMIQTCATLTLEKLAKFLPRSLSLFAKSS